MEKVIERHYYSGPVMEALVGESVLAASLSVQLQGIGISLVGEEGLFPSLIRTFSKASLLVPYPRLKHVDSPNILPWKYISELNPTDSEIDWEAVEQGAHELCVILENEFIQFQPASESKSVIERAKQSLVDWGMLRFRAIPDSSGEQTLDTVRKQNDGRMDQL